MSPPGAITQPASPAAPFVAPPRTAVPPPGAPGGRPSGVIRAPLPPAAPPATSSPSGLRAPPPAVAPVSRPPAPPAVAPVQAAAGGSGGLPRVPGAPPGIAPARGGLPFPGGAPPRPPPVAAPPHAPGVGPAPISSRPSIVAASAGALPPRKNSGPLPETGAVEQVPPAQAAELSRLARGLDALDYFQVLQVPPTAVAADIKRAFYRESRIYHPDRFFHLDDAAPKDDIGRIYRRITEAYYVLRDEAKRRKYLADLASPERAAKLRYTEASEVEQKAEAKRAQEDEYGTNPKARPFFKSAMKEMMSQNWAAAERNLKLGLTYEPGNQRFKERLGEVQKKLDEQRRTSGDSFKIR